MNQWGRIKAKNFIIVLTLCVTLINENHTYLAKADDETQSSADSYIERKIKMVRLIPQYIMIKI